MIQRLSREQLYNYVWCDPMSVLAPSLRISESKLKNACASALIPLPGRIFWAKRRAGKAIVQIDLPARPAGMSEFVFFGGTQYSWLQGLSDDKNLDANLNCVTLDLQLCSYFRRELFIRLPPKLSRLAKTQFDFALRARVWRWGTR